MRNGVPFDVAFGVDDVTRAGWCIIFSEMEGGQEFDFGAMTFKEKQK